MDPQLIGLGWSIIVIIGVVLLVIIRQWFLEYRPPKWRQRRWQEENDIVIHYEPKWQSWFAWRPVRTVGGEVVWWSEVYRCIGNDYVDHDDWRWYHYGNIMDVLKETK